MERPNRCFIRQEWFEAVSYMSPEQRCAFYEGLMSFVYYGSQKDTQDPAVKAVLEMCKPQLLKDIGAFEQKVIVNRQNGSSGGRPREGITQKNPNKPNLTQKTHYIQLHIQDEKDSNKSFSTAVGREKKILVELFARGVNLPLEETKRLCDYYDARGWVDKGGNPIVDVAALARVWKVQDASVYWANVRQKWAVFCRSLPDDMPASVITQFTRLEIRELEGQKRAIIYAKSRDLADTIEANYIPYLRAAVQLWKAKSVEYKIDMSNNL